MDDAQETWPLAQPAPRIDDRVKRAPSRPLNRQALLSIGVVLIWAVVVVAVTVISAGTTPTQFDYDNGAVPPPQTDRHLNALAGVVYVLALPVSLIALWLAARSLRKPREQVSSTIAVILTVLASLAGIGLVAVGVGTFIFFT
ncbi:hypothetical protein [Curtobacterium sp. MCSS17_016]|uniref:hypothetical protein n=1 Tax=Curtobacterium sp. MCSS17_016 TaxID=2175644 RepID=UPI000DB1606D|nr:hypothetical protein [Curtobacterium sp. MCSS17_016]WIE80998.1 hypothetical protein DEJ19_021000 [Curtobacterium sp. MCSS17_016]